MAAAECLYLAAKLEVAPDIFILKNTKAVDYGDWSPSPLDHLIRIQLQIRCMPDAENQGLHTVERRRQVFCTRT